MKNDQGKITVEPGSNESPAQFLKAKKLQESWQEMVQSFQQLERNLRSLQDSLKLLHEALSTLQKLAPSERVKMTRLVQQTLQRARKGFVYQVSSSLH